MRKLKKLVLLGTGLIGGSFSLALKRAGCVEYVVGVGRNSDNLSRALELKVIDEASQDAVSAVTDADLVLLSAPVGQMAALLQQIAPHLPAHCIVSDAGSTKQDVCALYQKYLPHHLSRCVPGHPIAGSELSGAAAAQYGLYEGRRVVLTPLAESAAESVEFLRALWQACGAQVFEMSAAEHDGVFSAVSHVPHLLAFSYMNAVLDRHNASLCFDFAATGFRDFTRIAASHPEMWRDITLANKDAILLDLKANAAQLLALIDCIENHDASGLNERIVRASTARSQWGRQSRS
ncbi:prephenate dehydrogenase/arogenate dehydrogenase family protein [Iodobacter sp. LRB]|uniref:prephenate dehydrogenase n=1 Tax=unclassified Iodobacter TaxID=235634 RepID=UPI000C11174A|nr:prephenate dehydrogenase/arogenate dehydrogenase family protein [Iodobacter sp. BJB302]PHV03646.1 prephenate dehydrogenase [Iodobacter sp. BJB302]